MRKNKQTQLYEHLLKGEKHSLGRGCKFIMSFASKVMTNDGCPALFVLSEERIE